MCTREHIATLKAQNRELAAAARMRPTTPLTAAEREQMQAYDDWLRAQSQKTLELAERGEAATTAATRVSFNQEYLKLQVQMQHENRAYTAISNVMKTKHDTVKNSIGNVR